MSSTRSLGGALIFLAMAAGLGVAAFADPEGVESGALPDSQVGAEDRSDEASPAGEGQDEATDLSYWGSWGCGVRGCAPGDTVCGVDFNITQSEGCWGSGNDYDEPFRRVACCAQPGVGDECYWTGWSCGPILCPGGHYVQKVDFNSQQSEGCWGAGNDYDEPFRRVQCCKAAFPPSSCHWTDWGCGEMVCPGGDAVRGIDFNIHQGEGCWGAGNNYDEPKRRLLCCTPGDVGG